MVVLYQNNTGEKILYNYKEKTLEYVNYLKKEKLAIPVEQLVEIIKKNGTRRSVKIEEDLKIQQELEKIKEDPELVFKRLKKLNPMVTKKNNLLYPLDLPGVYALVKKELQKNGIKYTTKELKSIVTSVLLYLENNYYKSKNIPSVKTIIELVRKFIPQN